MIVDLCINVLCHTGQECVIVSGSATCVCKRLCPEHEKPVCGSNGMTYPNHCELHRTACLEEKKISVKHIGTCKGQFSVRGRRMMRGWKRVGLGPIYGCIVTGEYLISLCVQASIWAFQNVYPDLLLLKNLFSFWHRFPWKLSLVYIILMSFCFYIVLSAMFE